ncbi:MAG: nucleotide exchange factor GrpE [Fimbriimonas sp.]|jgi:molecular chaperone GrpE|nr:nucleotide exchange factor GrpE [Fimbriimonas sp.]
MDEQQVQDTLTNEQSAEQVEGDLNAISDAVSKLTEERDQIQDQLVRTMADFQNYKKRQQAEQSMVRQYATESLIMTLLPALDNFSRAVNAAENGGSMESLLTGVKAIDKQLRFILEQQGVQAMVSIGQPFDANMHEAIGTVATDDFEADTVVQEVATGYRMGDRIIRPATVRVSVKP